MKTQKPEIEKMRATVAAFDKEQKRKAAQVVWDNLQEVTRNACGGVPPTKPTMRRAVDHRAPRWTFFLEDVGDDTFARCSVEFSDGKSYSINRRLCHVDERHSVEGHGGGLGNVSELSAEGEMRAALDAKHAADLKNVVSKLEVAHV